MPFQQAVFVYFCMMKQAVGSQTDAEHGLCSAPARVDPASRDAVASPWSKSYVQTFMVPRQYLGWSFAEVSRVGPDSTHEGRIS